MGDWDVVSEAPAAAAPTAPANPWQVVSEAPAPSQGRGIWQAIKDYPEHFVKGVLETPEQAFGVSEKLRTTGEMSPDDAMTMAGAAMLGGVKLGKTVGKGGAVTPEERARIAEKPMEAPVAPEWKPVSETPAPGVEPNASVQLSKSGKDRYTINDSEGKPIAHADIGIVEIDGKKLAQIDDIYTPALENVKTQAEHDAAVAAARNILGTSQMRNAMRQFLEMNPEVEGFTGNRTSGARNAGKMSSDNIQNITVDVDRAKQLKATEAPKPAEPPPLPEPTPKEMNSAQRAPRVVKNILIPDEVSPVAESAAADIRQAGGKAARDTETTRAALDAEQKKVAALSDQDKLGLIDYIETRSQEGAAPVRPDLKPVADAVKTAMDLRRSRLEKLDSTEKARFVQDYYTHLWKDPEAAMREFGGPAKEGSGRFLKERSVPTVAEGIARGLEPVSVDPLETTMRYVQSMDRFIATEEVIGKAMKDGTVKHFTPGEQPPGWVEVNTRKGNTNPLYAPEDWARVYNNFVDRGIHKNKDWGNIYDTARNASNAVTSLELGLSGFHAATMAQEAMVNGVAKAIGELASGKPIAAVKSLVKTPVTPVSNVLKGRTLEHVYLGKKQGTPLMREITDLLTEAGGRAKGISHSPENQFTSGRSYWDSFKHGTMLMEAKALGREFKDAPVSTTLKTPFRQVGRILQTVAKPLFEYTIPKLKNGAFYDNMASWMEANPKATKPEQLKAARKIWDSIDNRFGETVQDNIFWNKTLKQSLQLALRSYSWTFGTIQEIGGGAKDLIRHPTSISPKSKHYSPKAAYVIALPIVYGTINAVYQKLRTGKDPESIDDVMRGGLTGGTAPGVGGRGTVPERVMMPGYMKDVFGWYHHPVQEITNKVATLPRMVKETVTNKDWKDQPIRNPNDPTTVQVRQYLEYVYRSLGPISVKQLMKGQKEGSKITAGEAALGLRPTPQFLQDPEGYERMKKGIGQRDWQKKERYDKRQEKQYVR